MLELEKTYLLKYLPAGLEEAKHAEYLDIYIPSAARHPVLRVRKRGDILEMTKKFLTEEQDAAIHTEQTITLSQEEYEELTQLAGKRIQKVRYQLPFEGRICEVDIFHGAFRGLALVDFEFETVEEMNAFSPPDFCLAEVTQDETFGGGFLAGKNYEDIQDKLNEYKYQPLNSII